MSEKYFNAYVDSAVGMIHEHVAANLQLKAQLKVTSDLLAEKDNVINALSEEMQNLRNQNADAETARVNAKHWEDSYHGMMNKVSHMETLTSQYNDLKRDFLAKCAEIDTLNSRIHELENPVKPSKKVINKKTEEKAEVDDF
jgi:chromosome segregation ATPase